MEKELAIITGADGGMGQEITKEIARAGYPIIMACKNAQKATPICEQIKKETGNTLIEIREINLASLTSVNSFTEQLLKEGRPISRLMNNAGILTTPTRKTEDGLETIISVNYVGPYMLTRQLLPLMRPGSRIVNTVSCSSIIGKIEPKVFFEKGNSGPFFRIPVYGNSKLALHLFTQELAKQIQERGITANASDPGIVNTNMITMQAWFDPITDLIFRPLIKTAAQGAATAIHLALSEEAKGKNGSCYVNCKEKKQSKRMQNHPFQKQLWEDTEKLIRSKGFYL